MQNRKKQLAFSWMVIVIGIAAGSSWGFSHKPPAPDFLPDKVLVKFHDGVGPARITQILETVGGNVQSVLTSTRVHIVLLDEGVEVSDAVERLSSFREVRYAEPVERAQLLEDK